MIVLTIAFLQIGVSQAAKASGSSALEVTTLVQRARSARLQQEKQLASYEAIARQRMSSSIGLASGVTGASIGAIARGGAIGALGAIGANRLAARFESVARVGWDHKLGAYGEVIGARSVLPIMGYPEPEGETGGEPAVVLPYYPGRDRLWPMSEMATDLPKFKDWLAHPLDRGADSVYRYSLGDSLDIRLPDKRVLRLREIRVQPVRPSSQLMVGSLWVDVGSGALVRAAYRPSIAIDLWPFLEREIRNKDDAEKVKRLGPFTGVIREVIIEHGLYDGKFWLPKTRTASAEGTASGGRVTISIQQTFDYNTVTSLPAGSVNADSMPTLDIDPRTGRVRNQRRGGIARGPRVCKPAGDSSARWSADSLLRDDRVMLRYSEGIPIRIVEPCTKRELATSPALPASIYSPGEELFPTTDFKALQKDAESALAMDKQAAWNPLPINLHYGIDAGMLRYNRVEGLSPGIAFDRELGQGYATGGLARIGTADREPLAELFLQRGNVATTLRGTVYRRLDAANDWGNPLGLGASISALAFGRDEGFYFRTFGAELSGIRRSTSDVFVATWRLFAEQQRTAPVRTSLSLAKATGAEFIPNIGADEGFYGGAMTSLAYTWGLDPRGLRVSGNTRFEGAGGHLSYGRAMTELTLTHGIGDRTQFSLTGSGGYSAGTMPAQRFWYLGGPYTIHGHQAGSVSGNSFWMTRAQLSRGHPMVRPVLFADLGWAGDRGTFAQSTGRISGAGVGAMFLDGLVRLDVSRGIRPTQSWRTDFYFEIR